MRLKGEFSWYQSICQGGKKAISFVLTNINWLQSETFDAAIIDGSGQNQPMVFRLLNLEKQKSFRFDMDTVGWNWCQGDQFAILNKKGQVDKHWILNLKTYARGECPECHGTYKCLQCMGNGIVADHRTHTVSSCTVCRGSGVCQKCYVPIRNVPMFNGEGIQQSIPAEGGVSQQLPNPNAVRQRKIAGLRQRIYELQTKVEKVEWDMRMMELKGSNVSSYGMYSSYLNMKMRYEQDLIKLQSQLEQLDQMNY